jgi:S1-C subfamily serine protease
MQDEGNGNEQSGWKPPEYVSPWASTPASDGDEGSQDTVAFGSGERDEPEEPTRSYPQPETQRGGFAGYGRPWGQAQTGDSGQPGPGQGGYQSQGSSGFGAGSAGYGGTQGEYGTPGGYGGAGQGGPGYGAPGQGAGGYGAPGQGGGGYGGPGYGAPGYGGAGYGGHGFGTPDMPDYYPGRRGSGLGRFLIYAAVAVLAAGAGAGAAVALNHSANPSSGISSNDVPAPNNAAPGNNNNAASGGSLNQQALEAKVDPSIVNVTSTLKYQNETAEGTGIILSANGLVLTNNHVIDGATSVRAELAVSGKTYTATVLGYDSTDDVALLQLNGASGLTQVSVGNSNAVKLNDPVLALGNAQGKMGTPSAAAGIVNALNRTISASDSGNSSFTETLHNMIQTNAQIQEGDSGGPLVNASGQVIGMDTAANTTGDQFGQSTATTGFAIPINKALTIARQVASGKATTTVHIGLAGFMGVGVADISQADRCLQGSSGFGGGGIGNYTPPVNSGAVVCNAYSGTPAASSGLAAGDVITSVDGQAVSNEAGLTKVTNATHPNDKITVVYVDTNGSKHTTTFSLLEIAK